MAKNDKNTVDMVALVSSRLSGKDGFANTKKIKRMGLEGYTQWLTGKLAEKASSQINNPRRKKRAEKSKTR